MNVRLSLSRCYAFFLFKLLSTEDSTSPNRFAFVETRVMVSKSLFSFSSCACMLWILFEMRLLSSPCKISSEFFPSRTNAASSSLSAMTACPPKLSTIRSSQQSLCGGIAFKLIRYFWIANTGLPELRTRSCPRLLEMTSFAPLFLLKCSWKYLWQVVSFVPRLVPRKRLFS